MEGTNTQTKDPAATAHTRRRYNLLAPLYNLMEAPVEYFRYRAWRKRLWAGVPGPEVLELGVGTGKNIPYYPSDVRVTAVDLSPRMLKRARRMARRRPDVPVTLLEMDIQRLDFPDEVFDDTVATFVFCSVPDPVLGLREALRVTRRGGRLFLLEHMLSSRPRLAWLMKRLDPLVHWLIGVHIARRTVENVAAAGWVVDRVTSLTKNDVYRMIEAHKP